MGEYDNDYTLKEFFEKEEEENRFEVVYSQRIMHGIQILVDKKTGVNYLICYSSNGSGCTPLLDREGKPVISPIVGE